MLDISEDRIPIERNHGKLIHPYSMYTVPEYEELRYQNRLQQRLSEISRDIHSLSLPQLLVVGDAIGLDRPSHLPKEITHVEQQTTPSTTRVDHAYRNYDVDKRKGK
jgi:hypothetical protein